MVNYWLRTNKIENWDFTKKRFKLWDTMQTRKYLIGDNIIIYIIDGINKYLVGIYSFEADNCLKPILELSRENWLERPSVEEWKKLLSKSVMENTPFDINNNSSWIGRVSSQGLKLTKGDFDTLKKLLEIQSTEF